MARPWSLPEPPALVAHSRAPLGLYLTTNTSLLVLFALLLVSVTVSNRALVRKNPVMETFPQLSTATAWAASAESPPPERAQSRLPLASKRAAKASVSPLLMRLVAPRDAL